MIRDQEKHKLLELSDGADFYSLSVFISPPPLSWGRLLVLLVLRIGMLWCVGGGGGGGADVRSSSESLLLELSSLLEEEELLESEELSLLIWSMTLASAINSVQTEAHKQQLMCD